MKKAEPRVRASSLQNFLVRLGRDAGFDPSLSGGGTLVFDDRIIVTMVPEGIHDRSDRRFDPHADQGGDAAADVFFFAPIGCFRSDADDDFPPYVQPSYAQPDNNKNALIGLLREAMDGNFMWRDRWGSYLCQDQGSVFLALPVGLADVGYDDFLICLRDFARHCRYWQKFFADADNAAFVAQWIAPPESREKPIAKTRAKMGKKTGKRTGPGNGKRSRPDGHEDAGGNMSGDAHNDVGGDAGGDMSGDAGDADNHRGRFPWRRRPAHGTGLQEI